MSKVAPAMRIICAPKKHSIRVIGLISWLALFIIFSVKLPISAQGSSPTPVATQTDDESEKIAFVSKIGTEDAIFVANADGSNIHTLVRMSNPVTDLDWSPDGKDIAITQKDKNDDCSHIDIMQADGTHLYRLVNDPNYTCEGTPRWSPDSTQIAFLGGEADGDSGIYVMDLKTSSIESVDLSYGDRSLTWASDGKRIAFTENSGANWVIWIKNVDQSATDIIDRDGIDYPLHDVIQVAWSPDGKSIVFDTDRREIYSVSPDGSNLHLLAPNGLNPAWSPDGRQLAFTADDQGISRIYIMDATGMNIHLLTTRNSAEWSPTWIRTDFSNKLN